MHMYISIGILILDGRSPFQYEDDVLYQCDQLRVIENRLFFNTELAIQIR